MPEAILEKETCTACGVDVREGTSFCYACGTQIVRIEEKIDEPPEPEIFRTFDPDATKDAESSKSNKLAMAAAERRKSRTGTRKPRKIVWEEPSEGANQVFVLITFLIFLIAVCVVIFTVLIK